MPDWRPDASLALLQARAKLLADTRVFFAQERVMEVETPILAQASVTEVNIQSLQLSQVLGLHDKRSYFLQTSPEYAMKRLLAAGSGAIYQVARVFRQGEAGSRHNPEFSLLEWYQPGFSLMQLMQQVADYCCLILGPLELDFIAYRQAFKRYLGFDSELISDSELADFGAQHFKLQSQLSRQQWLDLLMSQLIEPKLDGTKLSFVYDYPAAQAALAKVAKDADGVVVAQRFEVFYQGLELANGYDELLDAKEQRARFEHDRMERRHQGLADIPVDENLLSALASGLPDCCGVALGLDRLLMLAQKQNQIKQVLAFATDKA